MSLSRFTDRGALETREFVHSRRLASVADDLNFIAHIFFRRPHQPPPDLANWNKSLEAFREICQKYQELYPEHYFFEEGFEAPYPSWMARVGEPVAAIHRQDFETPLYSLLSGTDTDDQLRETVPPLVRDLVALGRPHGRLLITDIWIDTRSNKGNRPFLPDFPFVAKVGSHLEDPRQLGLLIHQIVVHDGDRTEVDLKDPAWSEISLRKVNWKEICEVLIADDLDAALLRAQQKARGATREFFAQIAKLPRREASGHDEVGRGGTQTAAEKSVTSPPLPPQPKPKVDLGPWIRQAQNHYREVAAFQARVESAAAGLGAAVDSSRRSWSEAQELRAGVETPLAAARGSHREVLELRRKSGAHEHAAIEASGQSARSLTEAQEFSRSGIPEGAEISVLERGAQVAEAARVEVGECLQSLDDLRAGGDQALEVVEAAAAAIGDVERQVAAALQALETQSGEVAGWLAEWRTAFDQAGAAHRSVAGLEPEAPDLEAAASAMVENLAALRERAGDLAQRILDAQAAIEQSVLQGRNQVAGGKKALKEGREAAEKLREILDEARSRFEHAESRTDAAKQAASEASETLQRLRLGPVVSAQRAAAEAEELVRTIDGERASLEATLTQTLATADRLRSSTEALPGTTSKVSKALQSLDGGGRTVEGLAAESQRVVRVAEGLMRQGRQIAELTVAALPASTALGLEVGKAKRGIDAELGKLQDTWGRAERSSKEVVELASEVRNASEGSGAVRQEFELARAAWEASAKTADAAVAQVSESRRVGDRVVAEIQSEVAKARNAARQAEATDGAARLEASTQTRRHLGSAKERARALSDERGKAVEHQQRTQVAEAEAGTRGSAVQAIAARIDNQARLTADLVARAQAAGRSALEAEKQILSAFSALVASLCEIAGRIGEGAVAQWRAAGAEATRQIESTPQRRAALQACRRLAEVEVAKLEALDAARAEGERAGQKHLEAIRAARQTGTAAERKADEVIARLGEGLRNYGKQISQAPLFRQRLADGEEALRVAVAHLDSEARQAEESVSAGAAVIAEVGEKFEHARSLAGSIREQVNQGEAALAALEARRGDAEARAQQADSLAATIERLRSAPTAPGESTTRSRVEALAGLLSQLGEAGRSEALAKDSSPSLAMVAEAQTNAEAWTQQLSEGVAELPPRIEAYRQSERNAVRSVAPLEGRSDAVSRAQADLETLERELNCVLDPIRQGRRRKLATWVAAVSGFAAAVVYLVGTHLVTAPGPDLSLTLEELDPTNVVLKVRSLLKPEVQWTPTNIAGVAVAGPGSTTLSIQGLPNGGSTQFQWVVRTPFRQSSGRVDIKVRPGTRPEFQFQASTPTELTENAILQKPTIESAAGGGIGYRWWRVINGARQPFPDSQFGRAIGEIVEPEANLLTLICQASNRFGTNDREYRVTVSSHLAARDPSSVPETLRVTPGQPFTLEAPSAWKVPSARFQWLDAQGRPMPNQTNPSLTQMASSRADLGPRFVAVRHRGLSLTNPFVVEVQKLEIVLAGARSALPNAPISIEATVNPPMVAGSRISRTNLWRRNGVEFRKSDLKIDDRAPPETGRVIYEFEVSDSFQRVTNHWTVNVSDTRPAPLFAKVDETGRRPKPGEFRLGDSGYRILINRLGTPTRTRFVPVVDPSDRDEVEDKLSWLGASAAPALQKVNGGWEVEMPNSDRTNQLQAVLMRGKQGTTNLYEVVFGQPPKVVNTATWRGELQEGVPWEWSPKVEGTGPVEVKFRRRGNSAAAPLTLPKPSVDDLGMYQVTVANLFGSDSVDLALTNLVLRPPTILVRTNANQFGQAFPSEFTVKEGTMIYAGLAPGSPTDGIVWRLGADEISSNPSTSFPLTSKGQPFVNVTAHRRIKSFESKASEAVRIFVGQGPQTPRIRFSSRAEVEDGESVQLGVEGRTAGWSLNWSIGDWETAEPDPRLVLTNKTSGLRAVAVKVTVSNPYGTNSAQTNLAVRPPKPQLLPKAALPATLKLVMGTQTNLDFTADFHTGIQWTRDGQVLSETTQDQKSVRIALAGKYRGVATNAFHQSTPVEFTVAVSMPPKTVRVGDASLSMVPSGLGSLWVSQTEVSQGFWSSIRNSLPPALVGSPQVEKLRGANKPVVNVRFDEVLEFISNLNQNNAEFVFRLPTKAEWVEMARRRYPNLEVPTSECLVGASVYPMEVNNPSISPSSDELHYLGGNVKEMTANGRSLETCLGVGRPRLIGGARATCKLSDDPPSETANPGFVQTDGKGLDIVGFRLVGELKR